jgi:enterochelin esterase-like enzyme
MASRRRLAAITVQVGPASASPPDADQSAKQTQMHSRGFRWCASPEQVAASKQGVGSRPAWPKGLTHQSFASPSMGEDVGYCVYLPPSYDASAPDWRVGRLNGGDRQYPVVYYLHGGRPGSELASTRMAAFFSEAMEAGTVPHAIYIFVNGGPLSHYNYPHDTAYGSTAKQGLGCDVFINELIPHIDSTYRTVADRSGRGLEGFSQGGRGVVRYMFAHPELFCSAAPGGAGLGAERAQANDNGVESSSFEPPLASMVSDGKATTLTLEPATPRGGSDATDGEIDMEKLAYKGLAFVPGYNAYDLAKDYAAKYSAAEHKSLAIQFHCGMTCFNYVNNLAYYEFLDTLDIKYSTIATWDVGHNPVGIYEKNGHDIMLFHARNFGQLSFE